MNPARILLVTFYYQPDLSAGSFRTAALVDALLEHPVTVDVITTLPHRYHNFRTPAAERDIADRVSIHRIKLPSHKSGMIDQAIAFSQFARAAAKLGAACKYDLVIGTSGRLMTAVVASWIAWRQNTPLYLDIRDIFVDNLKFLLPKAAAFFLQPTFAALERWAFGRAFHINLVSRGFTPYFSARYPTHSFSYFTNGVDEEFEEPLTNGGAPAAETQRLRIVYAGNLGEAQGLHAIIPALAQRLNGRALFTLIGEGGRRLQLQRALSEASVDNVQILPPMPRDQLLEHYRAADVLFLQLNDYDAFKTVLPSKIFEYAASGKPIWAGVAGYPAQFLREEVSNVAVFAPCNANEALTAFEGLQIRDTPRPDFVEKFSRKRIMQAMAADIVSRVPSR